jgi:hypothetical protein
VVFQQVYFEGLTIDDIFWSRANALQQHQARASRPPVLVQVRKLANALHFEAIHLIDERVLGIRFQSTISIEGHHNVFEDVTVTSSVRPRTKVERFTIDLKESSPKLAPTSCVGLSTCFASQ